MRRHLSSDGFSPLAADPWQCREGQNAIEGRLGCSGSFARRGKPHLYQVRFTDRVGRATLSLTVEDMPEPTS